MDRFLPLLSMNFHYFNNIQYQNFFNLISKILFIPPIVYHLSIQHFLGTCYILLPVHRNYKTQVNILHNYYLQFLIQANSYNQELYLHMGYVHINILYNYLHYLHKLYISLNIINKSHLFLCNIPQHNISYKYIYPKNQVNLLKA